VPTTLDIHNHPHPSLSRSTGRRGKTFLAVALPPFLLLALLTACCYLAANPTLGLYLGGLALAMTLTPQFVIAHRASIERVLSVGSLIDGVGIVWLVAMFQSDVTFGQWLTAYILLAACAIAAAGLTLALARGIGALFASALTTVIGLAWLTWPIWLSAWIDHPSVVGVIGWLVPLHPLLALNGLLAHLGVWGESPLMYQLTSLGQDVPYNLPHSIAMCAGTHLLLGGALLLLSAARKPRAAVDEPDRHAR
jgi:hypothetical protein